MPTPTQFLSSHGLDVATIDPEALLQRFDTAMTRGLDGCTKDALLMLPAYLTAGRPVPADTPVAVLDAGGTNLRAATVRFDADGQPHIEGFVRTQIPGAQREVTADEFYDTLADLLAPHAARTKTVGFCFSYPVETTPACDARLLCWTKQIRAPAVVGTLVGANLRQRLARRGCDRPVAVLNDTVATLLAGAAAGGRHASHVGFILGTGTNTAYVEQTANIRKLSGRKGRAGPPDPPTDDAADGCVVPACCGGSGGPALPRHPATMIVNVESGSFFLAPRSRFDERFDATLPDCGAYAFEKMIGGAYLGRLGHSILREAARAGLFSPAAAAALLALPAPDSKDLDLFCHNPQQPPATFSALPLTDADRRAMVELCTPVYERAALFAATNIAAAVIRTGAGRDPLRPVAVNIEGSTYYRTVAIPFAARVQEHLRRLLEPRRIHYELLAIADSPLLGAAVAGLTGPASR